MTDNNNDVDLNALLDDAKKSEEVDTSGASDQKTTPDGETGKDSKIAPKDGEEEISPRAQQRIQELVDENKRLKDSKSDDPKKPADGFTNLDEFVNAIEDEPSRKLLKTYGELLQKQFGEKIDPVLGQFNESKFDSEFGKFVEKVPALAAFKDDIKKSFIRNPGQSVKALVGEAMVENIFTKVKPIEGSGGLANRGKADISSASKEDLYTILEGMRE